LPDFYIDKYPVTNRQYGVFLNQAQPDQQELAKWIDLKGFFRKERCRIKAKGKGYRIEGGYEDHPVIYVSWFGAKV
jgi:sulfatase modifying factor 1